MGGCLLTENLQWGAIFMMNQALPPDPEIVGEAWRESWRQRLEHLPNFPELWLGHPWRDDYWAEGSVRDHIERIDIPVYAIGGWADAYSNAVPRLVANLTSPAKGLIGPWAHTFPHLGVPGPAIGFLQEAVRWWDRWLKAKGSAFCRHTPSRPSTWNLYRVPSPTFGTNSSHTPLLPSERMRWPTPSQ